MDTTSYSAMFFLLGGIIGFLLRWLLETTYTDFEENSEEGGQ